MKVHFKTDDIELKEVKRPGTPKQVLDAIENANKTINLTFMERLTAGLKATKEARKSRKNQSNIIDNLFNK